MAFIYDLTDTWNAGGTTFNAIKMNVTDTASAAASRLLTLQVGGAERFAVDKSGIGTFASVVRVAGGSTGAPAFSFGSDTNTGMWSPSSDAIAFSTAGSERLRVDSSGNVGIGTSSPSSYGRLSVSGNIVLGPLTRNQATTQSVGVWTAGDPADDGRANIGFTTVAGAASSSSFITFATNNYGVSGGERMRITSGGEVYIAGTTDQGAYNLQVNGTGVWGAGAYVNGSDRNLKDEIAPLADALDLVNALKPVTFRYKEEYSKDQSIQPGFIAQELQEALADQVYLDGIVQAGPEHLNVAYQSLIPVLVKAIQELTARVAQLEGN